MGVSLTTMEGMPASVKEICFARMQAEDLFEVKAQISERMQVLDLTGDWQQQELKMQQHL